MLDESTLPFLGAGRNLLAFSGGVDSTALFFLLLREEIPFDIVHVNYHTREQSDAESAYARSLASQYGKACHILNAEPIACNFEAEARRIRYAYFESVIAEHGYRTLLTAHQLDDRLEWLLMQLCKGAGLPELLGMEPLSQRDLGCTKSQLRSWLSEEEIPYFEDVSNVDERHLRNRFRHRFSEPLLESYRCGIEKSFHFLGQDSKALLPQRDPEIDAEILMLQAPVERFELLRIVDRWMKRHGYVMRQGEKERLYDEDDLLIGRRFTLSITQRCILLTPAAEATAMPKTFKEQCRILGIGPKVRPYLYANSAIFEAVKARLNASTGAAEMSR